jgi:phosphoglycolate phosphatase-like HAD superfamily hydrolase
MMFVFDFDGVLADSSALCLDLLRRVSNDAAMSQPVPDDLWDRLDDISFPAIVQYLGIPPDRVAGYVRRIFEGMTAESYRPALFAGIDVVLPALAKEGHVAILSASPAAVIEAALERAGLAGTVGAICDGRDPRSKRAKLPALLAQFGASPSRSVMVGDAVSDIRAGRANGMRTAAVTWGWHREAWLAAAEPDWLFTRVDALLTLPDRLKSQTS